MPEPTPPDVIKRNLVQWLDYQQRIHPRSVELGLDRVNAVWQRMGAPRPAPVVISVGGTNGKGSTVALLEAMLAAAGKRVGCYTSPHLLRYNERIRVAGVDANDARLIDAFERIEAARAEIALTYFEFGTLAALWIFAHSKLDVALLEVGLGGRLDAVNIIAADAAIVATVGLDHQDWLGNDVDSIGREKAGIFRAGRPAIIGMHEPPAGLLDATQRIGAQVLRAGNDFHAQQQREGWNWVCGNEVVILPAPGLDAPCQIDNAASAIAALHALRATLGWNPPALARGVRDARVAARLQRWRKPEAPELLIDVAHNPQAAGVLAQWLATHAPDGHNFAAFAALADKDVGGIIAPLATHIAAWCVGGLEAESPRGRSAAQTRARILAAAPHAQVTVQADMASALDQVASVARAGDRILAFGSFFVAAAALQWAARNGYRTAAQ